MAKPRTFISSTFFDLADARAVLADHLRLLGHEPLTSESSTFGVSFGKHSHDACLDQIDHSDYFILIIGGRRGGTYVGSEKSITNEEYRRALKKRKPVMTFVKREVEAARRLYGQNPKGNFTGVVDDVRIFDFIQLVSSQSEDNWIKQFDTVEDVKTAITSQFAYVALEYSKDLIASRTPKKDEKDDRPLIPFPKQMNIAAETEDSSAAASTISGLKGVHSVLSRIISGSAGGKDEKLKLLWVLGRYGDSTYSGTIRMDEDRFKQYAWSSYKGDRVFKQIRDFGVDGSYGDPDEDGRDVRISFDGDEDGGVATALQKYVADLVERFGDDGLGLFRKADMTIYM